MGGRMTDICARCRFWEFLHQPRHEYSHGQCHRRAAVAIPEAISDVCKFLGRIACATEETANVEHEEVMVDYRYESVDKFHINEWPITSAWAWCGEFEPRTGVVDTSKEGAAWKAQMAAAEAWEAEVGLDGSGAFSDSKWPDDKK